MIFRPFAALALCSCVAAAAPVEKRGLEMIVQAGHSGRVTMADRSANFLVTAGEDRVIKLWRGIRLLRNFTGHRGAIAGARIAPDERTIVSWSSDDILGEHAVRTWATDGSAHAVLFDKGRGYSIHDVWFEGDAIAVAVDDSVELWRGGKRANVRKRDDTTPPAPTATSAPLPSVADRAITAVAFHPSGDRFAVADASGRVQIWSTELRRLHALQAHAGAVVALAYAPDGRRFVTAGADKTVTLWRDDGTRERVIDGLADIAVGIAWAPSGERLALAIAGSGGAEIRALDGKKIATVPGPSKWVSAVAWGNGDRIAIAQSSPYGDQVSVMRADGSEARSFTLGKDSGGALSVAFSPDGTRLLTGDLSFKAKLWTLDGRLVAELAGHEFGLTATFAPDGQTITTASGDGDVRLWTKDGRLLRTLSGHSDGVSGAVIAGELVLSGSRDTTFRLWRKDTGAWVALTADPKLDAWIAFDARGYFDATRTGGYRLAAVDGTAAYGIDRFALRKNRPDLLLERLGTGSPELRAHYRERHRRRLARLGLSDDETAWHVPVSRIINGMQHGQELRLSFSCEDDRDELVRYDLYVNGVRVLGKASHGRFFIAEESVVLARGRNAVQVACIDASGVESHRAEAFYEHDGASEPDLYFIGLGVSRYARPELALSWAKKDAEDMAALARSLKGYRHVEASVFTDEAVTPEALLAAKSALARAREEDTVILFIAGHGLHADDAAAEYYFLPSSADPSRLEETALSFATIEALLDGIRPRKKLFLMDTCESGSLDDDVEARTASVPGARARGVKARRSAVAARAWLRDRDRFIYDDLTRRTGAVVFSSSRGGEPSFESDEVQNGFFTAALKRGLRGEANEAKRNQIALSELRAFVTKTVAALSQDQQHPTVDRDNFYLDVSFVPP